METELFDDKESMEYSPFSLYVLRDSIFNGIDIRGHIRETYGKEHPETEESEITHQVDHMFEKYYIDRYVYAQTAEERLTIYTSIYTAYLRMLDDEEADQTELELIKDALDEMPMYVLDAWNGEIYKVDAN